MPQVFDVRSVAPIIANAGLSDWNARSTAAGVVQHTRFASATPVTTYTHPDSMAGNVSWNPSGGILGDGGLRIAVNPSDQANSGNWRIPLNAAWTTGGGQSQGFGTGVDWYVQYRVKLGPNRLTPSVAGGGFKIHILGGYFFASPGSSNSDINCECVWSNDEWGGGPIAYNHDYQGNFQIFQPTDGNGNIRQQNVIDHGSGVTPDANRYCIYNGGSGFLSPGCWFFHEQEWFTVYQRVNNASFGNSNPAGNIYQGWVARAGETSYTQLWDFSGVYTNGDASDPGQPDDAPNGQQALWLLPYDTGRTSSSVTTWHEYDQVIVSTQPIACPQV